jgi:hypothetical protein
MNIARPRRFEEDPQRLRVQSRAPRGDLADETGGISPGTVLRVVPDSEGAAQNKASAISIGSCHVDAMVSVRQVANVKVSAKTGSVTVEQVRMMFRNIGAREARHERADRPPVNPQFET